MVSTLEWYFRRFRAMQARELIWRSSHAALGVVPTWRRKSGELQSGFQQKDWNRALASFRSSVNRPVLLDRDLAVEIAARHPEHVSDLIAAAESAVNLSFQFFGYPAVSLRQPIDWNHEPIAGQQGPSRGASRFGGRRIAGDVKWIWELNRLQHLPLLAQAWLFTGDVRYSTAALEQLDNWIENNPPGRGIAWHGAFEAGIRAISITVALQGLRDAAELTPERFRRIVGVLAQSANRCWQDRSLFSSANNHLVGEMTGLAVIAMMFPELRNSKRWERHSIHALSIEASNQVLVDGTGAEQAIAYQMFTVELLHLVAVLLAQRDGCAPDPIIPGDNA